MDVEEGGHEFSFLLCFSRFENQGSRHFGQDMFSKSLPFRFVKHKDTEVMYPTSTFCRGAVQRVNPQSRFGGWWVRIKWHDYAYFIAGRFT